MNDEDAFQAALDANPSDHVTRLVFADWLDERSDVRAAGYRALGTLRIWPCNIDSDAFTDADRKEMRSGYLGKEWWYCNSKMPQFRNHYLPPEWWCVVKGERPHTNAQGAYRRSVEDAAAKAFGLFTAETMAHILARGILT